MARYIDADKAMEEINRIGGHNLCEWETIGVKALIDRQPTADVVPKSEVAMELFAELDKVIREHKEGYCCDWYMYEKHAELKKKYMKKDEGSAE